MVSWPAKEDKKYHKSSRHIEKDQNGRRVIIPFATGKRAEGKTLTLSGMDDNSPEGKWDHPESGQHTVNTHTCARGVGNVCVLGEEGVWNLSDKPKGAGKSAGKDTGAGAALDGDDDGQTDSPGGARGEDKWEPEERQCT